MSEANDHIIFVQNWNKEWENDNIKSNSFKITHGSV